MPAKLKVYKEKRNFSITPEPSAAGTRSRGGLAFVIQKHWASHLHYDFRIELNGVMKSWAVPKGPSLDPKDKRMAVHVEDHPISYNSFEGQIPAKQYGAGKVIIWDKGSWHPLGDPVKQYHNGHLKFELHGHKLHGRWALIRMKSNGVRKEAWLLIKETDDYARAASDYSVLDAEPDSVAATTALDAAQIKSQSKRGRMPRGALKAALPQYLAPQLATLAEVAPADNNAWSYEIKFDGYRLLTRVTEKTLHLYTRNGNDWTGKLSKLAAALAKMKLPPGWYDGEIVILDAQGIPSFQGLQQAFDSAATQEIIYYLFDLPFCDGYDLRKVPLSERRQLLQALFTQKTPASVRFSENFDVAPKDIVASVCGMGLEGVIGKRKDSPYVTRRSADWIKLKCTRRQEFVIGGYTDPKGARVGIGSLLLGVHDEEGKLRYAGNVGTGFDQRSLTALEQRLRDIATDHKPFDGPTGRYHNPHWVRPILLAEISFAEWTRDGNIRHAVFHGLRSDKPPRAIVKEKAMHLIARQQTVATTAKSVKVTHGERIIDDSSGIAKIDLIRYYSLVAPLIGEHLKARPTSLVRAPDGISGELFFQKHLGDIDMPGVRQLSPALDPGHAPLLEIAKPEGLLSAAQMNVIEFHTWNALKTSIMKPDRMTFDLDPGDKTDWPTVQQAALLLRSLLQQLELESMIKTSGGKGLHVVVPLRKQYGWDTVKDFSHAIVEHMAATLPDRFTAKSGPRNRSGKIFVDYLRNGFGATTVAAWSARARPGLGVSVPFAWNELDKVTSGAHWSLANVGTRLHKGNTPWDAHPVAPQNITHGMKILGFDPQASHTELKR
ncbi:MAG: DNA ligase D [Collimonas pratensis]|uniref:DNA ligase D n=1 Tax=Collimonas pratensis TaxID=279113 RepID=UPI003C78B21B